MMLFKVEAKSEHDKRYTEIAETDDEQQANQIAESRRKRGEKVRVMTTHRGHQYRVS